MFTLWGFLKGILIKDVNDSTKQLSLEIDPIATSETRTTVKSAQTADRTIILPDADDTLVGKVTVDVFENKTINADLNTITNLENSNIKTGAAIDATKIHDGSVDNTEFSYLDGVTSNIQNQLDNTASLTDLTDHINDDNNPHDTIAGILPYDNSASGLIAVEVQSAIDEVNTKVNTNTSNISNKADTSDVVLKSDFTTKGDVLVGSGVGTFLSVPVGTNGQVLKANSTEASGVKWEDESGGAESEGFKNYFDRESSTFENATVGNWSTDDGSGNPSTILSVDVESVNPIEKLHSLLLQKTIGDATGHYFKCELNPIDDNEDKESLLFGGVSIDSTDVAYVNGYYKIEAWDITTTPEKLEINGGDPIIEKGKFRVPFNIKTNIDTVNIELRIVPTTTENLAFDVIADKFSQGPTTIIPSSIERSEVINLAGSGDFVSGLIRVNRKGNKTLVANLTQLVVNLVNSPTSAAGVLPDWAVPEVNQANVCDSDSSTITKARVNTDGSFGLTFNLYTGIETTKSTCNIANVGFNSEPETFTVSSNTLQQQRVRAGSNNSSLGINFPNVTWTKAEFGAISYDKFNIIDLANNRIIANRNGLAKISALIKFGPNALAHRRQIALYKNGTRIEESITVVTVAGEPTINYSYELELEINDFIEFYAFQDSGGFSVLNVQSFSYVMDEDFTTMGVVKNKEDLTLRDIKYFTSNDTYIKPVGLRAIEIEVVGGGGGGSGAQTTNAAQVSMGSGGGAGGYCKKFIRSQDFASSESIVVGLGGAGGVGVAGTDGNPSSFGSICTAGGGQRGFRLTGIEPTDSIIGGDGGSALGGDINIPGSPGGFAFYTDTKGNTGEGGDSFLSKSAKYVIFLVNAPIGSNGVNGSGFGAGGSGAANGKNNGTNRTGGNGSDGIVIIKEYF